MRSLTFSLSLYLSLSLAGQHAMVASRSSSPHDMALLLASKTLDLI